MFRQHNTDNPIEIYPSDPTGSSQPGGYYGHDSIITVRWPKMLMTFDEDYNTTVPVYNFPEFHICFFTSNETTFTSANAFYCHHNHAYKFKFLDVTDEP